MKWNFLSSMKKYQFVSSFVVVASSHYPMPSILFFLGSKETHVLDNFQTRQTRPGNYMFVWNGRFINVDL
jgi:hypothetical protein